MMLLAKLDFTLPITNPVFIFLIVLVIILWAPAFSRLKIPQIIFLIMAGVIVGPFGINMLTRDGSIVLFGAVGLLYIIFLTGLELDLTEFRRNKSKVIVFGLTTFLMPMTVGGLASYFFLHFSFLSSMLLASMFSTHTLVSYPTVRKYGVSQNKAVLITVGGTIITDGLALLCLAVISGVAQGHETQHFWVRFSIYSLAFIAVIYFVYPVMIEWFFRKYNDEISQFIFVLLIVFSASLLAEAAGLEGLLGAFFAGLILNRFVPQTSALKKQIDFTGNALFIPIFLISIGMLVDVRIFLHGTGALVVAAVIISIALVTKYIAAAVCAKLFGLPKSEKWLVFGLSSSHAAATLAIILVGYNIIIGETPSGLPIRLLNEDVLDGTILLILVSCSVSSFIVEKSARNIANSQGLL